MRIAVDRNGHRRPGRGVRARRGRTRSSSSSATTAPAATRTRSRTTGSALDTGFIVHNARNYPGLTRLFRELGVRTQALGHVVLGVVRAAPGSSTPAGGRSAHAPVRLIREIIRFLREARGTIDERARADGRRRTSPSTATRAQFRDHFLVPLTVVALVERHRRGARLPGRLHALVLRHARDARLPAEAVADGRRRQPRATSRRCSSAPGRGCTSGCRVRAVTRADATGWRCAPPTTRRAGSTASSLAVHGDQALALLADPTTTSGACSRRLPLDRERDRAAHRRAAAARAGAPARHGTTGSPTARRRTGTRRSRTTSTGSRPSTTDEHYCVTLNRTDEIDESRVIRRIAYEHPLYTFESLRGAGASCPR